MITNSMMFNNSTLNIFTDASIYQDKYTKEYISCPGANVLTGPDPVSNILEQPRYIIRNSTNNNGEISAINLGVDMALKYGAHFQTINIISDSQICVSGLREWIFNWVNNVQSGVMFSSSGKPVANQEMFLQIVYKILYYKIHINFYHQRGHMDIRKQTDLYKASSDFVRSNHIKQEVDMQLIKNICIANDTVDKFTKEELDNFRLVYDEIDKNYLSDVQKLIKFSYKDFNTSQYRNYIGLK